MQYLIVLILVTLAACQSGQPTFPQQTFPQQTYPVNPSGPDSPCWTVAAGAPCSGNGICVNANDGSGNQTCICTKYYGNVSCDYPLKSRTLVACMSAFFGGLGVDRFIMGYPGHGAGKLILGLFALIPLCIGCCCVCAILCGSGRSDFGFKEIWFLAIPICIWICIFIGIIVFWAYDLHGFASNTIPDSNGFYMYTGS